MEDIRMTRLTVYVFALAVVATGFMPANMAKAQPYVTDGLVSYWNFDKATIDGNIVKDIRGNNDGTINGNPQKVGGKFGEALKFNGATDYVECGNDESLKMEDATTLEAWMLLDNFPFPASYRTVITEHDPAFNNGKIFRFTNNQLQFLLGPAGTPMATYDFDSSAAGKWQHIVTTYDGETMLIYVNGKKEGEMALPGKIPVNPNPLWIAHSGWGEFFEGIFDEIRIYNRTLSEAEVNRNMDATAVEPTGKLTTTWARIK